MAICTLKTIFSMSVLQDKPWKIWSFMYRQYSLWKDILKCFLLSLSSVGIQEADASPFSPDGKCVSLSNVGFRF